MLSWVGKRDPPHPAAPVIAYAPAAASPRSETLTAPRPAPTTVASAATAGSPDVAARTPLGPPLRPWTQRYAAAAPAPDGAPRATSGGARYYSLHSAYGLVPDAAPIPPQFFGPTADMTVSETNDPIRRASSTTAAASTTAAINAARLASEAQ